MAYLRDIPEDEASSEVRTLYEADRASNGYVSNQTRLFAHRPAVLEAWKALRAALTAEIDLRRYELVTLAAAQRLRSSYCMLAHGQVLAERFLDPDAVRAVVADRGSAGLDPVELAVMDLAEKIVDDATSVTQADVDRLRELGLSDAEIFDIVVTATARTFYSKTLDALGAQPDAAFAELEPALSELLTVGRPIADR